MTSTKRSRSTGLPPSKKARTLSSLPWKPIKWTTDGDDGILELDEVDGVEVVYEQTPSGRVATFKMPDRGDDIPTVEEDDEDEADENSDAESLHETDHFDALPDWANLNLTSNLLRILHSINFTSPTPIQAQSIPSALAGRDIIGVAQTGSGKTLAYGLPILDHLLSTPKRNRNKKRRLTALILAPTRELALQIVDHLNACVPPPPSDTKTPPLISIAALVGGLSTQKQRRIISRGVDILVATPGRLWDTIQEGTDDDGLGKQIAECRFLVVDEADRMVQAGHFEELDRILGLMRRKGEQEGSEQDPDKAVQVAIRPMQTFVFSATLSKDLQTNLSKRRYYSKKAKASTLDDLLLRLDFRDSEPVIIDLSPAGGVVDTLQESKIECLSDEKDIYLYYFLLRYPGRTIVFLSSIDGIRRLLPLMETLGIKAFPLHSQLEQRQRLKNLDRFKSLSKSVLLATDIASRGLDIPLVDHVIHYQPPRSADAYVHRVGRTARNGRSGFSMGLVGPGERKSWKACINAVGRDDNDIAPLHVPLATLDKLKVRVSLAREIERAQHLIQKRNHEQGWMKEAAEALGVELDDEERDDSTARRIKNTQIKTAALKSQLKQLLSKPVLAVAGVSKSYITGGSHPIVDSLIAEDGYNEEMMGLKNGAPADHRVKIAKSAKTPKEAEIFEEWTGFGNVDS